LGVRGRTIEGLVKSHGAKQRLAPVKIPGVFREALLLKSVPSVRLVVDKTLPAFIGPGGSAEPNKRRNGTHLARVAHGRDGMKSASGYRAHRV
jgi:hypothetical protein